MPKELLKDTERTNCNDCSAAIGEEHIIGCDIERCPRCGMQLIGCVCFTKYTESGEAEWDIIGLNREGREKWSGISFEREMKYCEKWNYWVKWHNNSWQKTTRDDPDAVHDINTAHIKIHIDGEEE